MAITERKAPIEWYREFYGLSTDIKPTGVPIGSTFKETNTGFVFETADGTNWFKLVV